MVEIQVFERRLEVQHARWRLPSRARARRVPPLCTVCDRRLQQRLGERLAFGIQLVQRLADQARTARPGPAGAAGRRRRRPTTRPWPRRRACAPAPASPGRSGPGARCRSRPACDSPGRRPGAPRPGAAPAVGRRAAPACAQKNSRSCARRSDTSVALRQRRSTAASTREASALAIDIGLQQADGLGLEVAAAASCHKRGQAALCWPRARPASRSLHALRGAGHRGRASAPASRDSSCDCASASGRAWARRASGAASTQRQCQSRFHRSAGCTRSAPASSCSALYCGNIAAGETACRPAARAR